MYRRVKEYILKNNMIEENGIVLAGLSGGGDSMAMLFLLWKLGKEIPFKLTAVHVHHGIRGKEADRDMEQSREMCCRFGIPFHVHYYDVPALAEKWKTGLEEAGRCVRREAFDKETGLFGNEESRVRIALAHNKNDLAETILHHLSRGSGLRGLSSMRPVSGKIIRPMLCLERKEIELCLKENKIPYETDSSNLSDDYTRNRIRHHILPAMEQEINSGTVGHMAQTAQMIARAEDYLREQGKQLLEQCEKTPEGYFLNDKFAKAPDVIQSYAVQHIVEQISGHQKDFTFRHIEMVQELAEMRTGKEICLPYGLTARKTYNGIFVGIKVPESRKECAGEKDEISFLLKIPGVTEMGAASLHTDVFFFKDQKIEEKKYTKWLDYDKITGELYIRTRKTGDFMIVDENSSHKKLSRVMIDDKIPREQRNCVLVAACGSEVLWIIGGRINQRVKISGQTKRVLELKYQGGQINA